MAMGRKEAARSFSLPPHSSPLAVERRSSRARSDAVGQDRVQMTLMLLINALGSLETLRRQIHVLCSQHVLLIQLPSLFENLASSTAVPGPLRAQLGHGPPSANQMPALNACSIHICWKTNCQVDLCARCISFQNFLEQFWLDRKIERKVFVSSYKFVHS